MVGSNLVLLLDRAWAPKMPATVAMRWYTDYHKHDEEIMIHEKSVRLDIGALKAVVKRYFFTCAGAAKILTTGFFQKRYRQHVAMLVDTVRKPTVYHPRLRERPVTSCIEFDEKVRLISPEEISGNVSLFELLCIVHLVRKSTPRRIFEFGTFNGRTVLNMAANSPKDAVLYTIDLPVTPGPPSKEKLDPEEMLFVNSSARESRLYETTPWKKKIIQYTRDSTQFDLEELAGSIDFVFIDASHRYENVLADTRSAFALLRSKGGIILWHDYGGWEGVTRAVDQTYERLSKPENFFRIANTSLALYMPVA